MNLAQFLLALLLGNILSAKLLAGAAPPCSSTGPSSDSVLSNTGKHCFVTYKISLGWQGAVDFCSGKGGFLAKPHEGKFEPSQYVYIFERLSGKCGWVGLSKKGGGWQWIDGTKTIPYSWDNVVFASIFSFWTNCAVFCRTTSLAFVGSSAWKLSKRQCAEENYFICQFDAPTDLPSTLAETFEETTVLNVTKMDVFRSSVTRAFPADTYQQITTPAMVLHTSAQSQRQKTKKKPRRKPGNVSDQRRERLIKLALKGIALRGENIFDTRAFTVTMCGRECLKSAVCRTINFNAVTQRCVGFSSDTDIEEKRDRNWEVWQVY